MDLKQRLVEHLCIVYPDKDQTILADKLLAAMQLKADCETPPRHRNLWSEADNLLITYGNSIVSEGRKPLQVLHDFLKRKIGTHFSGVHILPFFPYSSDDGFSVMDYVAVNPSLGEWEDISAIASEYRLMSDLVINHASARSRWFENFKKRVDPGKNYFVEASTDSDLSSVVRPRNSGLLTPVQTADGERHVWCTFSADQVDLNFANPDLLIEFAGIMRFYMEQGVNIFRMDAVAFLWKEIGTPCVHLPQTHEIIKLLRTLVEHYNPDAVIITETNVPNRENLTYFGNANEAHLIYNFSLPPLLLYTLLSGDCRHLKTWMMSMPPAQAGTAYLNFIASHDGIGLRPLEGLVESSQIEQLVECMQQFGGHLTMRQASEGNEKPYEINIALFDALKGTMQDGIDQWQIDRFICAHAIMLALEGVPGIYIHSLLGTKNDLERVNHTGRFRSINRRIWQLDELESSLEDMGLHHKGVFQRLLAIISVRSQQPAFHPNATQFTLHVGTQVFAFWRQSMDRAQSIFCLYNITDQTQVLNLSDLNLIGTDQWRDLIAGVSVSDHSETLSLAPYQSVWLTNI